MGVSSAGVSWAPVLVYVGPVTDLPVALLLGGGWGKGLLGPCLSSSSSLAQTCSCDDFKVPKAREQRHQDLRGSAHIVTSKFCWLNKVIQQIGN